MTQGRRAGLVLCLVLLAGTGIRLYHLDFKTIRQGETYVPNLNLPAGVSDPSPRLTLTATLTGAMWDVHPPTWYLTMWPWTKALGTSLFAIRFPSVVFGIFAILLTFVLARKETDTGNALLAATLVAFNGHFIFWSQMARQYTLVACLSLASTIALDNATRPSARGRTWLVAYALLMLWGLFSLYYFWILLLSHFLWIATTNRFGQDAKRLLIRIMLLVVIAASPILPLAVFQATDRSLGADVAHFAGEYALFGFLFERDDTVSFQIGSGLQFALLATSLLLFAVGFLRLSRVRPPASASQPAEAPPLRWAAAAAFAVAAVIAVEAAVFNKYQPAKTWEELATVAVPAGALIAYRWWPQFQGWSSITLSGFLAIVPLLIVSVISLRAPVLASKAMLLFTPFLLVVLAAGIRQIAGTTPFRLLVTAVMILGIGFAHIRSIQFEYLRAGPKDYAGFGTAWRAELHDGDVIFARRDWATTGAFYYLEIQRYRFIGSEFEAALAQAHPARVWVLSRPDLPRTGSNDEAARNLPPGAHDINEGSDG